MTVAGSLSSASTDDDWRLRAACRTTSAAHFFPPNRPESKAEKDEREAAARAVCARCPVCGPCLDHALRAPEPHGIWGGRNELQRRWLRRRRGAEGDAAAT